MPIVVRRQGGILGDLQAEIARLENLLLDLRHLADGNLPSAENIAAAPIIDSWLATTRPEPCPVGTMHGHPTCKGPLSVTSSLQIFSSDFGWARTSSRFYRLGNWHTDGQGRPQ